MSEAMTIMNIRSSIGLVGLFLGMFWLFGLMLALDRTRVDEAFVMPSLKAASTVEIDSAVVERHGKGKDAEDSISRAKTTTGCSVKASSRSRSSRFASRP